MSDAPAVKCPHSSYKGNIKVTTATVPQLNVNSLIAIVTVKCAACGKPFVWKGRHGFSTSDPVVSPDQVTLRAPLLLPPDEEIEEIILPQIAKSRRRKPAKRREKKPTVH